MIKLIVIPIIDRKILLVTPPHDTLKAARKYKMGRNLISMVKDDPPDCQACCYQCDAKGRYILYFRIKTLRIIVHETDHVVKHMMKHLGAQQEQEFHAYVKEWLFNEVRKNLRIKRPP